MRIQRQFGPEDQIGLKFESNQKNIISKKNYMKSLFAF